MKSEYKISLAPITIEAAGDSVKGTLEQQQANFGFLPNMYQTMANAPAILKTYLFGYEQFRTETEFSSVEQEVIFMVISRENGCEYCVGAHKSCAMFGKTITALYSLTALTNSAKQHRV